MSALDFSELTDDQVVELAVALAREAMGRNPAMRAAFTQALLDERERVEAAVNGAAAVKRAALEQIAKQAERAEIEVQREMLRQRRQTACSGYLHQISGIIGKPVSELTLVWNRSPSGARGGKGPRLQLNQGSTSDLASWHLVDYADESQQLFTSPGLRTRHAELLPWCREVCAAFRALGVDRTLIIKGIEI